MSNPATRRSQTHILTLNPKNRLSPLLQGSPPMEDFSPVDLTIDWCAAFVDNCWAKCHKPTSTTPCPSTRRCRRGKRTSPGAGRLMSCRSARRITCCASRSSPAPHLLHRCGPRPRPDHRAQRCHGAVAGAFAYRRLPVSPPPGGKAEVLSDI